jgi:ferredoxin
MSFANKGEPMADPQCVRCSACVQMCPTGVLTFGQVDRATESPVASDPAWLAASPVLMREIGINGRPHRV